HIVQILGEFERQARAFFHVTLDGLLIPLEGLPLGRFAQTAPLDVQKNVYLPGPEGVAVDIAAEQFLNQAIELRQNCVAIGKGIIHTLGANKIYRSNEATMLTLYAALWQFT